MYRNKYKAPFSFFSFLLIISLWIACSSGIHCSTFMPRSLCSWPCLTIVVFLLHLKAFYQYFASSFFCLRIWNALSFYQWLFLSQPSPVIVSLNQTLSHTGAACLCPCHMLPVLFLPVSLHYLVILENNEVSVKPTLISYFPLSRK